MLAGLASLARALPAEGAAALWLARALARVATELPPEMAVERDELVELLGSEVATAPALSAGGAGGGVQLLSVTAARGRTFDRLYVIGLRRGVFPRSAVEDPLLPDAIRLQARALLPDLPVKTEAHAEERFLFDQLLAAAPFVTFSFAAVSDDGAERTASPLLDRLSWRDAATRRLRDLWGAPVAGEDPADLPPSPIEQARRWGLAGRREAWARALPAAWAEAAGRAAVEPEDRRRARHRAAVIDELDPDPRTPAGRRRWRSLGPFFGRVEPLPTGRLWVTQVQAAVDCAWKDFLGRRLGVEPLPDAADGLPDPLDGQRIGLGVHRLLEELLRERLPEPAGDDWSALASAAPAIDFPPPERVAARAREIAAELLAEDGLSRWGFEDLLAAELAAAAEIARYDWSDGPLPVVGVELEGSALLGPPEEGLEVAFRADRVEFDGRRWTLTDYKTGRGATVASLAGEGRLAAAIAAGGALQPAAYVAAFAGRPATGRLLALAPGDEPGPGADARLDETEAAALAGFARVARAVRAARAAGSALPRLVDPSGEERGPICRTCELLEACLQEDSGARRRLARWAAARRADRTGASGAERAEADLFLLPERAPDDPAGGR
jgi:hypothetical protein